MLLGAYAALSLIIGAGVCLANGAFSGLTWLWLLPAIAFGCLLVMIVLTFLLLLYLCKRVDQDVPQEDDDRFYRTFANLIMQSVLPVLRIHVKKSGLEKMPQDGRFLLICNHCSLFDPIGLLYSLPAYQLAFVSKRENRDLFVIGPMMHKLQCQLINRENDREALKTILKCIQILKEDKASIAVFPEGGILSEDGKLHHFRPGVFKIAQKANVPIVVCTLKNTLNVIPNLLRWKPSHVELDILDVIPAEEIKGVTTVDVADRCYRMMAEELGPDLVAD